MTINFIIFWLITIIITIEIKLTTLFILIKLIVNQGYKINLLKETLEPDYYKEYLDDYSIINFIPIINVLRSVIKTFDLKKKENLVINQFIKMNTLKKLTNEELERYRKKPTIFNAFVIMTKFSIKELNEKEVKEEIENNLDNNETISKIDENILNINKDLINLQRQKEKLLQERERLIEENSPKTISNNNTKTYQKKR